MAKLLYQGHASLRLQTNEGKTIYIDPYAGEGYDIPADLVLITHEHFDHNVIDKVPLTDRTIIIRSKNALIDDVYYDFSYFGVHIKAVPAANKNHDIHECVGYLITIDDKKVYVAGDTGPLPFMEELGKMDIDYALLPIDGVYTMSPEEATKVANIIKPKHLIPYHMHVGMLFDINMDKRVTYENTMLVMPGNVVEL